jgi:hypothetical protein
VADSLSRKCLLMQEFKVRTLGFDDLRDMYANDQDFKEAYGAAKNLVLQRQKLVDRVRDLGRIVVQGQSIVYSKLLHEREFVKGET